MKLAICSMLLITLLSGLCNAEVLVAKRKYLYQPGSEARRLLLEPGALLFRKDIPVEKQYKKRIRVISLGGIEGEVDPKGVDSVNDMSEKLAYVKNGVEIKGVKYRAGSVFPVQVAEDDDELIYRITYPKTSYSIKEDGFAINERHYEYSPEVFDKKFNFINPSMASTTKFPLWQFNKEHPPTEWGCEKGSKEEVLKIDHNAGVGASLEAGGGFFDFFHVKAETTGSMSVDKTTIYRKKLEDEDYRHRITYWKLIRKKDSYELLHLALEKISVCDTSKGIDNSYIIRFDKRLNLDEIRLNSIWAQDKGFEPGGGSPIRLDTRDDLGRFINAMNDFRLPHTKSGYNLKLAIIDFTVQYTVNLNISR